MHLKQGFLGTERLPAPQQRILQWKNLSATASELSGGHLWGLDVGGRADGNLPSFSILPPRQLLPPGPPLGLPQHPPVVAGWALLGFLSVNVHLGLQ